MDASLGGASIPSPVEITVSAEDTAPTRKAFERKYRSANIALAIVVALYIILAYSISMQHWYRGWVQLVPNVISIAAIGYAGWIAPRFSKRIVVPKRHFADGGAALKQFFREHGVAA